jgi:hypothetical protein
VHPSDPWPARDEQAPEDHKQNEAEMEDDCGIGEDTEDHDAKNLGVGRQGPRLKLIAKSVSLKNLFDHLVGSCQYVRRYCQADLLGGFEINHQLEFCRLLNRKFGGLGACRGDVLEMISGKAALLL